MRRVLLLLSTVVGLLWGGLSVAGAQNPGPTIAAGSYRGIVRCVGSDRFSNGLAIRRYRSSPMASVVFASSQRVRSWTYFFLSRHDLVKQVRAVRPGDSFTYAAGSHIGRPGRTGVTITDVTRTRGRVSINARLDWASPAARYIGSGTYALLLERVSGTEVRYEAVKVVVKQPLAGPSKANPVVRRNELCVGQLRS
jgi:hypothetical protein